MLDIPRQTLLMNVSFFLLFTHFAFFYLVEFQILSFDALVLEITVFSSIMKCCHYIIVDLFSLYKYQGWCNIDLCSSGGLASILNFT